MDYLSKIEEILSFGARSSNTIRSYKTYTAPFFDYCVDTLHKDPAEIDDSEIRSYILWLKDKRGLSDATLNHALSELRFFFECVICRGWNAKAVPHRRLERILPYVPDKDTVQSFIASIPDLKKKCMVVIMYSAGLRICEVCRLRTSDIQHRYGRIHVAPSKNGRDRYVILSETAFRLILSYWKGLPPTMRSREWLFSQQRNVEKPIYPQFIQDFIPRHEASLGWEHRLTCHSFRHAYATHSYLGGMDLETLSLLLGHSSTASTRIYIHLAQLGLRMRQFKSPLDDMEVGI